MNPWYIKLHEDIAKELKKECFSFEKIFSESAIDLMQNYSLVFSDVCYELVELEYYFFHLKHHRDPYVHKHCLQLTCNQFYIHERNFPRAGADITFGTDEYFGSILIRGIKRLKQKEDDKENTYIVGPSNCLKSIIIDTKIVPDDWKEYQKKLQLNLENKKLSESPIYQSLRCLSKISSFCDEDHFYSKKYRFAREDYYLDRSIKIAKKTSFSLYM